jgi:hypothetical protein
MRRILSPPLIGLCVALAAMIAACGGADGTGPGEGALKIGIVSGNNQSAQATTTQLANPIVGRLVRLPNGTLAWLNQATDAVLPEKAYAQGTVVNGSPVPGAVVCAATVDTLFKLVPIVPCTNTDSAGKATFAFTHGTVAGEAKAVVQGMVNGQVATFDTARATITPGPVASFGWYPPGRDTTVSVGTVLDFQTYPVRARDQFGNIVPKSDYTFTSQRINADPALSDQAPVAGWLVTVRAGDTGIKVFGNGIGESTVFLHFKP